MEFYALGLGGLALLSSPNPQLNRLTFPFLPLPDAAAIKSLDKALVCLTDHQLQKTVSVFERMSKNRDAILNKRNQRRTTSRKAHSRAAQTPSQLEQKFSKLSSKYKPQITLFKPPDVPSLVQTAKYFVPLTLLHLFLPKYGSSLKQFGGMAALSLLANRGKANYGYEASRGLTGKPRGTKARLAMQAGAQDKFRLEDLVATIVIVGMCGEGVALISAKLLYALLPSNAYVLTKEGGRDMVGQVFRNFGYWGSTLFFETRRWLERAKERETVI